MEIIFLIIGIIIGAILCYLWQQTRFKSLMINNLTEMNLETEKRIIAETELRKLIENQDEMEKRIKSSIEAVSTNAIKNNNDIFLQLAKQTLEHYASRSETGMKNQSDHLELILKPVKETIEKQEDLIKNLNNQSFQTFGSIISYIEMLNKNQQTLTKETHALVTALKAPRVRGRWGEIGLRRIVEFSGMSQYCDFEEQVNVNTEDGRMRPDMIVNLPDKKKIVIDSKVPLAAYLDSIETEDDELRKNFLLAHYKAVLTHVTQLSSKQYWSQFDNSIDFVVLYIEVEPALSAAMSLNINLLQEAIQNRIVFATPTTLITLLQTVAFSWKQHQATENTVKILQQSKEAYQRLVVLSEHLQKIGNNINMLTKSYNQTVASWETRILPEIKKMEELGVSTEKKSIATLTATDEKLFLPK